MAPLVLCVCPIVSVNQDHMTTARQLCTVNIQVWLDSARMPIECADDIYTLTMWVPQTCAHTHTE